MCSFKANEAISAVNSGVKLKNMLARSGPSLATAFIHKNGAAMDAAVPSGVTLPSTYDAQSGQTWTRDRAAYLPIDLVGRITTL